MQCSIPEILSYVEGYYNRLSHSYKQTRILAYTVYCAITDENRREDPEDWMPLWFDEPPEERRKRAEVQNIRRGIIAERDIEYYRSLGVDL